MNGSLTFLHPLILAATAFAIVPIILHLIHRKRAVKHNFAAIEFVLRSVRRTARAFRLKQLLLLLARIIIALLIPLIAARLVALPKHATSAATEPESVVIVVDNSYSMGCTIDNEPVFDRAKKIAERLVQSMPASTDIAILPLVPQPLETTLPSLTYDKQTIFDALDKLNLSQTFTPLDNALERSAEVLKSSPKKHKRVVIISDFARNGANITGAPFAALQVSPIVELLDATDSRPCPNITVSNLEATRDYSAGYSQWRISVSVRNYSNRPAKRVKIGIFLDGAQLLSGFVDVGAGEEETKVFTAKITSAGDHLLEARITHDNLRLDDKRLAVVSVPPVVKVLLVNGEPSTTFYKDELFYLRNALDPQRLGLSGIKLHEITVDQLLKPRFDDFDVVFLCNVPSLPDPAVSALKEFVQKGGGLFIAAGDQLQVDFYNSRLAELLPGELRTPKAPGGAEAVAHKVSVGIAPFENTVHPVLAVFDEKSRKALYGARFTKFMPFNPNPKRKKRILLRYTNKQPLLVEYTYGEGTVFFFTSTVDRDWSDFPIRTAFLPLMQESVKYLARAAATRPPRPLLVGESTRIGVPDKTNKVVLIKPNGKTINLKLETQKTETTTTKEVVIPPLWESGNYTLELKGSNLELKLVVNVDPNEGDTRRADKKAILTALRKNSGIAAEIAREGGILKEFAHFFAVALFVVLLAESYLAYSLAKPGNRYANKRRQV